MTDDGPAYRSIAHATCCRNLGLGHLRTRPYTPRTNGKAERFIRTLTEGWAYGRIYRHSTERQAALGGWLHFHDRRRPHSGIGGLTPYQRVSALREKNVPGKHS